VPPKVIYSLTETGESLRPIFRELSKWGIKNVLEKR
ncbi:MAG: winged helix-turn-helix transcriptional regulator, partial [Saprospiraceae bacterium]